MDCPRCSTPHPEAARFCARCGTPLTESVVRAQHYAAHPDEPVRALALLSTLMPQLSGHRHHTYRHASYAMLLAALVAAGFGMLSIALVLAALALPTLLLTYLHDHDVWRDEPLTVISVGFVLPLVLGFGVGLLATQFTPTALLTAPTRQFPAAGTIAELGLLVPVTVFICLLVAPILVTSRTRFGHPIDAVNASSLGGAALSLALSVVVQHGAFAGQAASAGDPATTVFVALTLGFLQPIIFATAAAVVVMRLRRPGSRPSTGAAQGLGLLVCYGLATTLLGSQGTGGVVFTTIIALPLAGAGLLAVRAELHRGLLSEAATALSGRADLDDVAGGPCLHCGASLVPSASFCQVCGVATATAGLAPLGASEVATHLPVRA